MRAFLFLLMLVSILFAKVDYSTMSTEELLAMMGYVPKKNEKIFQRELNKRVDTMSKKEKTIYLKNLKQKRK